MDLALQSKRQKGGQRGWTRMSQRESGRRESQKDNGGRRLRSPKGFGLQASGKSLINCEQVAKQSLGFPGIVYCEKINIWGN